jgi:truncated hemoglobin YjbI
MGESLLERYGRVTLAKVVTSFYGDVLRSPRLAPFFEHVPMSGLVEHQTMFMVMVMGGPSAFTVEEIEEVHQRLGIADEDFEEMLRLLESSLSKFEFDPDDAATVVAGYRTLQNQVVNHSRSHTDEG